MRTPRFVACVVAMGMAAVSLAQIPQITATSSHTPTLTPSNTATPTPMPTPWAVQGAEILVNQVATSATYGPSVSAGADHGFVIAWTDEILDGSGRGVFARRFSATGVPLSGDFQVNTTTTGHQYDPAIDSDALGNFIVVWTSRPGDAFDADVYARRFDTVGTPLGDDFLVNTYTTGDQLDPEVARDAAGNFVVVWTSAPAGAQAGQDGDGGGIYAQRFDAGGAAVGGEFLVNTTTVGNQETSSVAMSEAGQFFVVWKGPPEPGRFAIFGQMYEADGNPSAPEFLVSGPTGDDAQPDVGTMSGQFVVAYQHYVGPGPWNVFGRMYYGSGAALGDPFQVNTETVQQHWFPKVGAHSTSYRTTGFVITWETLGQDEPGQPHAGVYAQRFANTPFGTAAFFLASPPREGCEYQVNTYTTGPQARPAIAVDDRGQFVIAWDSEGQDDPSSGIIARRFGFPDAAAAKVDQTLSGGSSNHNGVLEPGERVVFDTAWHNPGTSSLDLQGTLSNLTGPSGPDYTIDDATASYGLISNGNVNDCLSNGSDCYEVTVSGTRPAQHWDATADETLTSDDGPLLGQPLPRIKTWPLHVGGSFADVPDTDPFYAFIENIFHRGVTAGGACGALSYCGEDVVLRQQMAVFLLKSIYGANFVPPAATGTVFDDVPTANPFAPWIEELARERIVAGCSAPPPPALPSYCPAAPVNRQQMAVLLLKMRFGPDFNPGICNGYFEDVPCDSPFAPYIQYLFVLQITDGCQASPPLYCPYDPTKRKQMAAFLVKTFQLSLYDPN
jgi:hypothetical protein